MTPEPLSKLEFSYHLPKVSLTLDHVSKSTKRNHSWFPFRNLSLHTILCPKFYMFLILKFIACKSFKTCTSPYAFQKIWLALRFQSVSKNVWYISPWISYVILALGPFTMALNHFYLTSNFCYTFKPYWDKIHQICKNAFLEPVYWEN